MSWLGNSVDTSMSVQLAKFNLAHKAWEFLKELHTMKYVAHKFNVWVRISKSHQGDKSIKDYCGEFSQFWYEISIFEPKWKDLENILLREKQIQEYEFCVFLMGKDLSLILQEFLFYIDQQFLLQMKLLLS